MSNITHTIFNSSDESITIPEDELLSNCLALGIFDINTADLTMMYSRIFKAHIKRAKRLLAALDGLAKDRDSEAARKEYVEARREVEVDCMYFKF